MKRGYFRMWRKIEDHPFYKEKRVFSKFEAWFDMICQASGTDRKIKDVDGQEVFLKRGQFLSSSRELAKRWNWSKSKVARYLNLLQVGHKMGHRITVKMGHRKNPKVGQHKSIITLLNYNKYNPLKNESGTPEKSKSGTPEKSKSGTKNGTLFKEGINKELPKNIPERKEQGRDKDHKRFLSQLCKKR